MENISSTDIRIELLRRGIKLSDIAKKANVSIAAVSRVISGKTKSKRISAIISSLIASEVSANDN